MIMVNNELYLEMSPLFRFAAEISVAKGYILLLPLRQGPYRLIDLSENVRRGLVVVLFLIRVYLLGPLIK